MVTVKTRPWRCSHCQAQLGVVCYQRGMPPALHPQRAACHMVRAGVVSFICPDCNGLVEWRERRPVA